MEVFTFFPGTAPLMVSIPHAASYLPPELKSRITPTASTLPDTDWNVPELYSFLKKYGITTLTATHSRYVIDLNRPSSGDSLYPGKVNTELVPLHTFAGAPIYHQDQGPTLKDIAERTVLYWQPYHDRLKTALAHIKAKYGYAILLDAHSICSEVPRLFEGTLADLNFGTADGASAPKSLTDTILKSLTGCPHSFTLNGRFKGGYITRHYGQPNERCYAIQLEIAQRSYMQETPPYSLDLQLANTLRNSLERILQTILDWSP